jgi:hypothetical protein
MKISRLQVDGGVTRNNFILQHTADIGDCEVVRYVHYVNNNNNNKLHSMKIRNNGKTDIQITM